MKFKKLMFMLALAIVILGAAGVCASDVNNTVIARGDDSAIELSQADAGEMMSLKEGELIGQTENDDVISEGDVGTFAELQGNITAAKPGSTLTLTKNYGWESGFDIEGIIIGKSMTIDGNGFKIDAKEKSRIFKITADNVMLKNIIFTNGKTTGNGGAAFFEKSGAVINCNFSNNFNDGGSVFFTGKGEVTYCNFFDNYAAYGGAVYFSDLGTLANCNFTDNTATKDGGAVYFQNTGDVRNCNFIASTSKNNGGALFFEKSATVTNCNFTGSTASNTGGAVYFSGDGELTNCSLADNTATKYGGAVYFSGDGELTNCSFANNTAKMGNAIYNSNHCTVCDSDFTNNPLTKGAIHSVTGDITFSNNVLDADDVVRGRNFTEIQKLIDLANEGDEITVDGLYTGFGIPIRITKSLTLTGQNNATLDAKKLSKILYITSDNVIIKNIQFTRGRAENEGAVYFYRTGTVTNCNFTDNEVIGEKGSGGAIYFNGAGNVIDSIFTDNRATRNGGAIYVEAQSINNNFSSQFYNNYAGQSGGAIFFHNLVQNNSFECIFRDNYAGYGGGMFFSKNANENRFSSDFINNTAKSCGGAMFFYSTTDRNNFTGRFINNSALGQIDPTNGNGGAITFKNVSTNSIFSSEFINNIAALNGGAVNYRETPRNIIFNTNFTNNTAQRGGRVNFFKTFEDVIFNGEFIGNSAENGGALAAGYGTIEDISFKNNHANNGGAVYLAGSGSTVNCNFTNNRATRNGGAVYISEKGNVVNCSFENNTAAHDGGAVYSKFGTVEDCNFTGNDASNDGGAVSLSYPSNVANCHFADNSAKNGGALYFLNDNDNVINCSFVANEATGRGGAVFFMTNQQVNATNCYFEGNSAPEGGVIFCYTWAVTADSIILKTDSDTTNNTLILSPKLEVYDFYSVYGSGENLTFYLTTHGGMPITNGNISMAVYLKDNAKQVFNHTFLSGTDWTVDLPVGFYYAFINTEYEEFEPIFRTIEITMPDVQFYVNVTSLTTNRNTVNITAKSNIPKNLLWDGKLIFILSNGTQINATYGVNGTWWAEYTFDDCGEYDVSASYVGLDNVAVNNGTITIHKEDSTITLDNIVLDYGDSRNVTVTTTGATGITANIDSVNVTVINNFTIRISGLKAGNHTLTVTTIADSIHNPVTKEVNITVNKLSTEIILANETLDLKVNDEFVVLANLTPAGAGNLSYSSNNESVVKVSDDGLITALSKGSATVTVSFAGNDNYAAAQNKTISVTVSLKDTGISVLNDTVSIVIDEVYEIGAVVVPENLTVNYTSSNPEVAGVDNGVVTGLKEGSAVITLTVGDDKVYKKSTAAVSVTVFKVPTEIIVNKATLELFVGDVASDVASLKPSTGDNLTYISNDSSVVKFEGNNLVAVANGTAAITVSYDGNDKYEAANSKVIEVTVSLKDASVSAEDIELNVGDNATIVPVTVPDDLNVTYEADDSGVVTVEDDVVTAVKEGTAKITLTVGGDGVYAENSTTITVTVSKISTVVSGKNYSQYAVDYYAGERGQYFTVQLKDANGNPVANKTVSFALSDKILNRTTDANGYARLQINMKDVNKLPVTVTFEGDEKYISTNASYVITINKKPITITAAAKTYKATAKTKKYTVTLKTIKGSSANGKIYLKSGKKVTLKLNGKTYTAKTNSKGQATFSLKITKKGKFTAVVKFAGDKTYKAATKKPKITIK
ncbi:right-handed parallel beta-helix repeat-containing protein [Methanobrevibacter sp.]|uniref:right-handed parallel beta-helix repeat-containing protein n=1 Tax=Methanobrevibacter sp. TaxID=66852 RepID=UPI00388F7907